MVRFDIKCITQMHLLKSGLSNGRQPGLWVQGDLGVNTFHIPVNWPLNERQEHSALPRHQSQDIVVSYRMDAEDPDTDRLTTLSVNSAPLALQA
jgi:hypothetical protein